jgi:uncharacterized protein YvpB
MRIWQQGVIGSLAFGLAGLVVCGALLLFPGGGRAQPAAWSRYAPPTAAALIATPSPTASRTPLPTSTPFQPLPLTPTFTPSPTRTPTPTLTPAPEIPAEASIEGIWGFPQAYNLSCESRSASDFARYFGVYFTELEFLYALPFSGNPEKGFVGSAGDPLGGLPPNGYGVHAGPVAKLLREFGLVAEAVRGMSFDQLRTEIAAGRPVMVWAIRDLGYSEPMTYTAPDGETVTVARFEHTFIVIGYGEDYITVLDNDRVYGVSTEQFLRSWGVLGRMAIVAVKSD